MGAYKNPIVLLHGTGLTSEMWDDFREALVDDGADAGSIYTVDLIGHGETPRPGRPLHIDDYVRQMRSRDEVQAPALTAKEREVLQLLAEGASTKEIAHKLSVSVKTIETHRHNIMNKLDLRSVVELTKYAIREGLTSLDG